jgi:hypothetical protein
MKKISLFIIICCMGMANVCAQEADAHSFVKSYSKAEGFQVITMNKAGINFTRLLAKVTNPKEDTSFLSKVSSIQLLVLSDEGYEKNIRPFEEAFTQFCGVAQYEQVVQIEDAESQTEIFSKMKEDGIVGLIILNKLNDSLQMVCLTGKFKPEDIESAISGEGGMQLFGGFNKK